MTSRTTTKPKAERKVERAAADIAGRPTKGDVSKQRRQHERASKLLAQLDALIVDANLTMLPMPDSIVRAVKAQSSRKKRAASGKLRCYERFSGDPTYYLYELDQASGTATPIGQQSTKPDCPACP